ncbi:MAG: hypothetical protein ABSF83_00460 [Nitrososphaerales archaeon]
MEVDNVFKIAAPYSRVRDSLTSRGWGFQGEDEEMEMDSFRNKKTGKELLVEDISDDFPVTFLMGELTVAEFSDIAGALTPEIELLEVDSSWEGKPTTVVVAMTDEQVTSMFGRRTKRGSLRSVTRRHRSEPEGQDSRRPRTLGGQAAISFDLVANIPLVAAEEAIGDDVRAISRPWSS